MYLMVYILCRPNLENTPLCVERVECEVHLAMDLGVRLRGQFEQAIVDVVPQIPVTLGGGLVLLGQKTSLIGNGNSAQSIDKI